MIPPGVRIFVCTTPVDLRRSFDGLALATQELLQQEPQSGALYCFINKRANRLKILWWDKNGYCLLYKRLHAALFRIPAGDTGQFSLRIDGNQLAILLCGVARQQRRRKRLTRDQK